MSRCLPACLSCLSVDEGERHSNDDDARARGQTTRPTRGAPPQERKERKAKTHLVRVTLEGGALGDLLRVVLGLADHALSLALELVADRGLRGRVAEERGEMRRDGTEARRQFSVDRTEEELLLGRRGSRGMWEVDASRDVLSSHCFLLLVWQKGERG